MPASPRPLLDPEAPDRFTVDKRLLRSLLSYLQSFTHPEKLTVLPETKEQLKKCEDRRDIVAAIINASGMFDVDGFKVTHKGLRWTTHPKVGALIRPYAYLSHLLRMEADLVRLLFGPHCPNDLLRHQWSAYPVTDHGLVVARLEHYLVNDTAICS